MSSPFPAYAEHANAPILGVFCVWCEKSLIIKHGYLKRNESHVKVYESIFKEVRKGHAWTKVFKGQ
jgi:hypothetical protein